MHNRTAKFLVFILLFILVALPTEKKDRILVKAATLAAYPSFCLGGWENPANASGEPNFFSENDSFSNSNSAILNQKVAQMFCGYFQAADKSYEPTRVTLKFSWKMDFGNEPIQTQMNPAIPDADSQVWSEIIASSAEPAESVSSTSTALIMEPTATSTETVPLPALEPTLIPEPMPSSTPLPETTSSPSVLFFINKAFAQTIGNSPNFLEIIYSLDGRNLQNIAKVNESNWKDLAINIPISSWDDIGKLQIQLNPLPTVDMPKIYLDGMWLETEYDYSILDSLRDGASAVLDATEKAGETLSDTMDMVANKVLEAVNSVLEPDTVKVAEKQKIAEEPAKPKLSFKVGNILQAQTKDLPWLRERDRKTKLKDNPDIPEIIEEDNGNSIKIDGSCTEENYTMLLFADKDGYFKDPSSAIFNRSEKCANGLFSRILTDRDFPPNIVDGAYYLVTADQPSNGPWRPHSEIKTIDINRK